MTRNQPSGQPARRYWVVSPNVKGDKDTVEGRKQVQRWKEASRGKRVAFMGWPPNDPTHRMGPMFAGLTEGGIMPGDIILIARRHRNEPDPVGFGVVRGGCLTRLKGFKPPGNQPFGSARRLWPFKRCEKVRGGIPLLDVLPRNQALFPLHPDKNSSRKKVCAWLVRELGKKQRRFDGKEGATTKFKHKRKLTPRIAIVDLPKSSHRGYTVQTKSQVIKATKNENNLVKRYEALLKRQGRKLETVEFGNLRCDGYEKKRRNLIEAKCSTKREHIRMAVGQLLDYAFLGRKKLGEPNKAILLPTKPDGEIEKWLRHLKISIIWREGRSFSDNAKGQFSGVR